MPFPVRVTIRVRSSDAGPSGRVEEGVLMAFFGEARRAYVEALNASEDDFRFRLHDARICLLSQPGPGGEVVVEVSCDELSEKGFRLRYRLVEAAGGGLLAEGSSSQVLVDERGVDLALPRVFRERVEALEGRGFPLPV